MICVRLKGCAYGVKKKNPFKSVYIPMICVRLKGCTYGVKKKNPFKSV